MKEIRTIFIDRYVFIARLSETASRAKMGQLERRHILAVSMPARDILIEAFESSGILVPQDQVFTRLDAANN